jgi:hypothetical protein
MLGNDFCFELIWHFIDLLGFERGAVYQKISLLFLANLVERSNGSRACT